MSENYNVGPGYYINDLQSDSNLADGDIVAVYVQKEKVVRGVLLSTVANFIFENTNPGDYFRSLTTINDINTADGQIYDLILQNDIWLRINNSTFSPIAITVNLPDNARDGQKISYSPVGALVDTVTITSVGGINENGNTDSLNQAVLVLDPFENNTASYVYSATTETWYVSGV